VTTGDYRCRIMRREEIPLAVDWAADEGWNPGLHHDAGVFASVDPEGFWIGELDGQPAACISAVRYDDAFAFLGFYIVRPELRRRGLGYRLWQAALARLGDRCIGLDGVPAQQHNYSKSGFVLAHRNIRFGAETPARLGPVFGVEIVPATMIPAATLAAYDRTCFQAPRAPFLRQWISLPGHIALAAVRDGRLAGYAVLRPCRRGSKIGPLFADDPGAARSLFAAAVAKAPAGPVFLDVPETNAPGVALAEEAGMTPSFETARMYTKPPPETALEKVFGVTSFELG
jgi:GNAT superfamily N-acetyltransferase